MYDELKDTLVKRLEELEKKIAPGRDNVKRIELDLKAAKNAIRVPLAEIEQINQALGMIEEDIKRNTHEERSSDG